MGAPLAAIGRDYGGQEVGVFFQQLGSTLNITEFTPHTFVEQGDHLVALGTMSGTARNTGQPFSTRWAHHWKFQDGQVIEFNDHFDSLNLYSAQVAEALPQR
jgi:ketosteroid isomerase-like protein